MRKSKLRRYQHGGYVRPMPPLPPANAKTFKNIDGRPVPRATPLRRHTPVMITGVRG